MTSKAWINALIGAVVTVILSFTILAPVLGGAVAGYLEQDRGARVGAISGVFASFPVLILATGFMGVFAVGGAAPIAVSLFFILFIVVLLPAYIIGLSAIGGYVGVYIHGELRG